MVLRIGGSIVTALKLGTADVTKVYLGTALIDLGQAPADTTAPTITSAATATVAEGAAFSRTLTANEVVTWSKVGGADAALFTLTGSVLSLAARDFEAPADGGANNSYAVTVRATDAAGNSSDQTITVTVANVLEVTLAALSLSAATIAEKASSGTVVGSITGAASGSIVTLVDDAGGRFAKSGSIIVAGLVATDYETATTHNITLRETHPDASNAPRDTVIAIAVTDVAEGGSTIPPADWRMPATATTSSGLSGSLSALNTAQAGPASKTRPTVTIGSAATEYVEWTVGETGTALLSFLPDVGLGTITVTKNGVDLGFSPSFPAGSAATSRRQFVRTSVNTGDVLRLTCAANGFARVLAPLLHKIPASGAYDAHLMFGASREEAQTSLAVETAIVAAYPARDPVIFNYSLSGANSAELAALVPALVSAYSGSAHFCEIGSIIGNDVSGGRPYDSSELAALNTNGDAILNPIKAAFRVGFSNTSFRHYTGTVLPTNQSAGSAPYNDAVIHPKILEHAPECYDATYLRARNDEYLAVLYSRASLASDGVHEAYAEARANWLSYWFGYVYSGAWPTAKVVTIVELAEAAKTPTAVNEAQYAVDALVSSAGKTALQARINAIPVSTLKTAQVGYGTSTPVAGWNKTAGATATGLLLADLLDPAGASTGWALTSTDAGNFNSTSAGAGSTHPRFPNAIGLTYISDTVGSLVQTIGGLDDTKTYNIIVFGSRSGTGTRNVDYSVNGGAIQTVNVLGNTTTALTFPNVAPSGGNIAITAGRGSGNTTGVYINGVIVEQNA